MPPPNSDGIKADLPADATLSDTVENSNTINNHGNNEDNDQRQTLIAADSSSSSSLHPHSTTGEQLPHSRDQHRMLNAAESLMAIFVPPSRQSSSSIDGDIDSVPPTSPPPTRPGLSSLVNRESLATLFTPPSLFRRQESSMTMPSQSSRKPSLLDATAAEDGEPVHKTLHLLGRAQPLQLSNNGIDDYEDTDESGRHRITVRSQLSVPAPARRRTTVDKTSSPCKRSYSDKLSPATAALQSMEMSEFQSTKDSLVTNNYINVAHAINDELPTTTKATPQIRSNLTLYDGDACPNRNTATASYLSSHSWDPSRAVEIAMQAAEWQRLGDTEAGRSHKIDSNTLMGTFKGVFLPTLQSVFGIVMFIRLPWITGMAGVGMTLVIIGMSVMCTLLTTLSMSAIATNGVVRAGGAYYMVSRSLGKEFGVSVGILLYLALSASFALFTAGAVELLVTQVAPQMSTGRLENDLRLYGSALLIVMTLIALLGMRNITRVSIGFISFVFIAIITIFVGLFASNRPGLSLKEITGFPGNLQANFGPGYDQPDLNGELNPQSMNFFRLFAIFFPSVTGVMAGSNRSGLLRRPDKSIPRGTLAAVGVSTLTYVLFVLLFGTVATGAFLRTKTPFNGLHVAVVSAPVQLLTLIGCIISAIGAGLQCVAGAPRLLYAVAKDDTIPVLRPLRVSRKGEPLRALLITFLLAECIVLVGSFDVIAPISTMLYLTCYAFINFSTTLLSYLQYPNWRPSWRFHHWSVSLLGALLCIVYMFLINWIFALIALVLVAALYKYSQYIGAQVEWGDGIFALNLSIAQRNLLALERHRRTHAKNWRPQIMAFMDCDKDGLPQHPMLLSFLSQLRKSGGLAVVTTVMDPNCLVSNINSGVAGSDSYTDTLDTLRMLLKQFQISGFPQLILSDRPADAKIVAVQSTGLGVLRPNTILLAYPTNWREDRPANRDDFVKILTNVIACDKVVILLKADNTSHPYPSNNSPTLSAKKTVDVYWIMHDGGVLTLLPYLLRKHRIWKKCRLRVFCVAQEHDDIEQMKRDLDGCLQRFRIDAESHVLDFSRYDISEFTYEKTLRMQQRDELLMEMRLASENDLFLKQNVRRGKKPDKQKTEFMHTSVKLNKYFMKNSKDSALVFCSLPTPTKSQSSADYLEYLDALCEGLPRVVLVKGSGMEVVTAYF